MIISLCPICGRAMCDHTMEERDQTYEEMMADLTEEELELCNNEPADSPKKIALGKRIRERQKVEREQKINRSYA